MPDGDEDADTAGNAWERTLAELDALAAEYREEGWTVTAVAAADTTPERPGGRTGERFGFTYIVPDNEADAVQAAVDGGGFERFEVYRTETGGTVFQVTAVLAPERSVAVLLAGGYDMTHAGPMLEAAHEEGAIYTHVQLLDGTHLGSFRHEDPYAFVPDLDERVADSDE